MGGGPAGSTVGSFLKKYLPRLNVVILERERFPRDHVGESQLPVISDLLAEVGVWDEVEAAGFPVKIGATYRWGRTDELWDFEFLANGKFDPQPRPAKYEGQRKETAFQVDRAIYDDILLRHAASLGCDVRQETSVRTVRRDGDRVTGLTLDDGTEVEAKYYVDATGHSGLLRRAMGVGTDCPTSLQNIAVWDYWRNAEWAVSVGVGGTRVLVLSQPYGWIWFIPLGPDRTSIGLVVPARYYKETGKRPEDLYLEAVQSDELVAKLTRNATRENLLSTTKDWSFVADRLAGENWFLAGESAGFADPILAAGLSLAHVGARDVAYAILAMVRGEYEPEWLRSHYDTTHRSQIRQHMRFADFWYTANGTFTDLRDYAKEIAGDAGLSMTSEEAWRWLGQGGFIERNSGLSVGGYGLQLAKQLVATFTSGDQFHEIVGMSHFKLNLEGAEKDWAASMRGGKISRHRMYRRGSKLLPIIGQMGWLAGLLKTERSLTDLLGIAQTFAIQSKIEKSDFPAFWAEIMTNLEALVGDGWVTGRTIADAQQVQPIRVDTSAAVHPHRV
jgi:flavin-dependent dehydrogenase